MTNFQRQKGLSLTGFMLVIALVCFFALVAMKLFPLYNESFAVTKSLESVAKDPKADKLPVIQLRRNFIRNANINGLSRFSEKDIKDYLTANKIGQKPRTMTMNYEARNNLFGNLDMVLVYEKTLELGTPAN